MNGPRIGILGSYGGMNLGDEAILQVIVEDIQRELQGQITVFSRNPEDTQRRHKVRAVPIRQMQKDDVCQELGALDLLILGGGGILFDGMAEEFLRIVSWADQLHIPFMVYAISVGPVTEPETKKNLVEMFNKALKITVREEEAKRKLHELGVENDVEITADPALLLKPEAFPEELLKQQGFMPDDGCPLVGFSVREPGRAAPDLNVDQYHEVLANAADYMVERFHARILFVAMERKENKDLQHSHAVAARMLNAQAAQVLKGEFTSGQILGLVKHMHFVVGMRLHILIFAAIQNVPFVPLPYAAKVIGFLKALEMPVPPLKDINSGKLCAFLDKCWDGRQGIQKRLGQKMPALQHMSAQNIRILKEAMGVIKEAK